MFDLSFALGVPALLFSVACAVSYSASDYFRKAVPSEADAVLVLFYSFGLEAPVLAFWLIASGDVHVSAGYLLPGLIAAPIGLGATLLFLVAVRRSPISLMVPLLALVPVLTALLGGLVIGEWPTPRQAAGILVVALGLFTLFIPARGGFHPLLVWRNLTREPGTLPMTGVVVLWSMSPPIDKLCLKYASVGMHGLLQLILLFLTTGSWLVMRGGIRVLAPPRGAAKSLLGAGLTAGIGYGLQLVAYQLTLVAVVEVIKRTVGLVGALIFGRAYFQESLTGPKVAGIAIIVLGLPLILLA